MTDWYDENIEEPVREIVRLLRNNGFNTECSCGHDMYVQCEYDMRDGTSDLHRLLFHNGFQNYTIHICHQVMDGHTYIHADIQFGEGWDVAVARKKKWDEGVEKHSTKIGWDEKGKMWVKKENEKQAQLRAELERISKDLQDQAPVCDKCGLKYKFIGKGLYEAQCKCP